MVAVPPAPSRSSSIRNVSCAVVAALALIAPARARAQAPAPPAQTNVDRTNQDLQLVASEPDFTLGALPTTLRMPAGKFDFRLTHRFSLAINSGTAGDFFRNFFNLDSSAQVGFELRYGLAGGTQLTFYRTNERTIQFLLQRELIAQDEHGRLSLDVLAAVEGRQNFSERYATTLAGVMSRRLGEHGAVYVEPIVVLNANTQPAAGEDRHTTLIGIGARIRLGRSRSYVVAEGAPRVAGFRPGFTHVSVGIERRAGGHLFQLNVSNSVGTTLAQVARGAVFKNQWYIGFNLTRKFY